MADCCPLCGRSKQMRWRKPLYGYWVCNRCVQWFAARRHAAWTIDLALIYFAIAWIAVFLGMPIPAWLQNAGGRANDVPVSPLDPVLFVLTMLLIVLKDGFRGRSPGKWLMGVHVVDEQTGQPIGFWQSLKRNWPTLLPVMPLIISGQLLHGKRAGDGMAGTRVVWNRHAADPIFAGTAIKTTTSEAAESPTAAGK